MKSWTRTKTIEPRLIGRQAGESVPYLSPAEARDLGVELIRASDSSSEVALTFHGGRVIVHRLKEKTT